jgi:hypothetical protein
LRMKSTAPDSKLPTTVRSSSTPESMMVLIWRFDLVTLELERGDQDGRHSVGVVCYEHAFDLTHLGLGGTPL